MTEKTWHIKIGDEEKGPYSAEELKGMLHRGEIEPDTLVKGPNVSEWTHIDELEIGEPLLDVRAEGGVALEENRMPEKVASSRPWIRFIGRMFDYAWFALVLGWFLAVFGLSVEQAPFGIMIIPFLWIFVETLLMGTWGSTPGKWMIATRVKRKDNRKLSFKDAVYRSLSVWWLGLAAGIPIISLVTMVVACVKLSNTGKTTWDRSGEFTVQHQKMGTFRIIGLIIFFLAFFWTLAPIFINVN